jgi:dolichyl-phosphate-mannose-protein mannosyltransferase
LTGPAIGEPDAERAAPSRTGSGDTGGILVLLALGLAFRLIIAYLLPGSGFSNDVQAFRFWANELATHGLDGFYGRGFFIDYSPGYLYVLWLVGVVGNALGGIGDLIKIPPILADVALGYLSWSMTIELGGSRRAALVGAAIVVVNPITWFDSSVWGQVDSVGVVVLLFAIRELWPPSSSHSSASSFRLSRSS